MSIKVYLARSDPWLSGKLTERAVLDPGTELVGSGREAELVIYPISGRSDAPAEETVRDLSRREIRRLFVYTQVDDPIPWAPGVYVSLPAGRAGNACTGGFFVPHHHREAGGIGDDLEAARGISPDLLWSFAGTVSSHPVRSRLAQLEDERGLLRDTQRWNDTIRWAWDSELRAEGRTAFASFAELLGRSSFVICPRGYGTSTFRLFEALQVGRCAVVLSDEWLPPPFVDWSSCAIRVPESAVDELPSILREREAEAPALGREARAVWERHFSPERQLQTLIDSCVAISASAPFRPAVAARALLRPSAIRKGMRRARERMALSSRRTQGADRR
jgi:hypothetical protein